MSKRGPDTNEAPASKRAKPFRIMDAMNDDSLLAGIERNGLKVTLLLQEPYDHPHAYGSVNHSFYKLYKVTPKFQENFERPKSGVSKPIFRLKKDHEYADDKAIISALKSFAEPKKRLRVREALNHGGLLIGVKKSGRQVTLQIQPEYNKPSVFKSINQSLYDLYQSSDEFKKKYKQPKHGMCSPVLQLKKGHGYRNRKEILAGLKTFLEPQKPLDVKAALQDGSLIKGAECVGLRVNLQLPEECYKASSCKAVNHALYRIYTASRAFQKRFRKPKTGTHKPLLYLRKNQGHMNGDEVVEALIGFVKETTLKSPFILDEPSANLAVTAADISVLPENVLHRHPGNKDFLTQLGEQLSNNNQ